MRHGRGETRVRVTSPKFRRMLQASSASGDSDHPRERRAGAGRARGADARAAAPANPAEPSRDGRAEAGAAESDGGTPAALASPASVRRSTDGQARAAPAAGPAQRAATGDSSPRAGWRTGRKLDRPGLGVRLRRSVSRPGRQARVRPAGGWGRRPRVSGRALAPPAQIMSPGLSRRAPARPGLRIVWPVCGTHKPRSEAGARASLPLPPTRAWQIYASSSTASRVPYLSSRTSIPAAPPDAKGGRPTRRHRFDSIGPASALWARCWGGAVISRAPTAFEDRRRRSRAPQKAAKPGGGRVNPKAGAAASVSRHLWVRALGVSMLRPGWA